MWRRLEETDSGWIGAGPDDDFDRMMEEEDAEFDLAQPHVMTTLGPIEPESLGLTLMGEPVGKILAEEAADVATIAPDRALLAEMADLHALGIRSLVTTGVIGASRFARLRWLSERAPIHVVALRRIDRAEFGGSSDFGGATDLAWGGLEAAADAVRAVAAEALVHEMRTTGFAVRIDAVTAEDAISAIVQLRAVGGDPARVWVGHLDWLDAGETAKRVLELGAAVAFDRLLDGAGRQTAALAASLMAAGRADRILFASGVRGSAHLRVQGHPRGMAATLEAFPLTLMEAGANAADVRRALIDNPARLLTIRGEDQ